ncbi:N-acetylglucosamine-6-phosphate deacetylase [Dielma fastidiosa]|uniref:Amidohydrolase family protein n=1 Tax=Dielma fastidiosa TaxID=1034346 RepID=A0AB35URC5_9FIRM|nr:amidohydrolase family protein [Dielma fastidiosa]MDY5169310.1 amidohydrolase family protein [Dielma fastidiosa]
MIIKCKRIVTEDGIVDGYLEIEGKKIKRITQREIGPVDVDASQYRIIPGIFDTHNHGTMGYAMMSAVSDDEANVRGYLKGLASQGVTAILPTAEFELFPVIAKVSKEENDGAKIIGIHSEGPYLNRVGEKAIDTGHPDISLDHLQAMIDAAEGTLKLVGLAPELENADKAIEFLTERGIRVAFTHSNCGYDEAIAAFRKGITVTTHTANVMSGIHHRRMGGLGACLLDPYVNNEIICDLLHVSKEMLQIMFKCKQYDKFMMISDNVPMAGAPIGRYMIDKDLAVNIDEKGYCLTDTGRLCGSTKPVLFGIRNLVEELELPLETVSKMASLNPCRVYGVGDTKGSLRVGKDADFVIISDNYQALQTYSEGRKVYDHEIDTHIFNQAFLDVMSAK